MKDNEIIRGIRENSESAWRTLFYETHARFLPVIAKLLGRKSETDCEDIYELACQDLMENVKEGKLVEGESTNVAGYLYTICWRRANRERESRKVEEKRLSRGVKFHVVEEDLEQYSPERLMGYDPMAEDLADLEAKEKALEFLDKVLAGIPESCRKILRRYYWDQLSMKDIAAAMGLKNEDSAKTTKNKCMNKFKSVANEMLAEDKELEKAVRRAVERNALRDLLDECRKESSGELQVAALTEKEDKD